MHYFHELDIEPLVNKTIILDIDGTITCEESYELRAEIIAHIKKLALCNKIFLCSNTPIKNRIEKLARTLEITPLISRYQKPNRNVLKSLMPIDKNELVIIGDKVLTEGLLALQFGALFIKVRRLTDGKENLFIRFTNVCDDRLYTLWKFFIKND